MTQSAALEYITFDDTTEQLQYQAAGTRSQILEVISDYFNLNTRLAFRNKLESYTMVTYQILFNNTLLKTNFTHKVKFTILVQKVC